MTPAELEAVIWQHWPTRGPEAGEHVDAIVAAAVAYAADRAWLAGWKPRPGRVRTGKDEENQP